MRISKRNAMNEEMEKRRQEAFAAVRTDEPRYEATKQQAMEGLAVLIGVIDLMAIFAAPRALARCLTGGTWVVTQEVVRQRLDAYLAVIEQIKNGSYADAEGKIRGTEDSIRRARAAVETWSFSGPAPMLLEQAGRDYIKAYGLPDPDEGWDLWEGPPADDEDPAHTSA
jgi:hypothetical protein